MSPTGRRHSPAHGYTVRQQQNGGMAKKSGGTPAMSALTAAGVSYSVLQYELGNQAQGWGTEAAQALNIDPARVFKTLMVSADGRLRVAIVPVSGNLDLKAMARACAAKKAELADPQDAQRATGYVLGGISPIGQKKAHETVIDDSALEFDTVLVSAGKRGLDIELRPQDLVAMTRATVATIRAT